MVRLELDRIRSAVAAIDPVFLNSPQYECAPLGDALGCSITLKVETLNPVRSFKGRGTETVMASLSQRGTARRPFVRARGTSVRRWRTAGRDAGSR